MVTSRRVERMVDYLRSRQADLRLFLDDVHDPYNMSAILRTADAAGLFYVDYARRGDFHVRIRKKVGQGSQRWLAVSQIPYDERLARLRRFGAQGYQIVATSLADDAKIYSDIDFTRPTVLVMGNEKEGVSDEVARLADWRIVIPMHGMAQSLNVSVASAIILYEAERQRRAGGMFERPSLDEETIARYLREWMARDARAKSRGRVDVEIINSMIKES